MKVCSVAVWCCSCILAKFVIMPNHFPISSWSHCHAPIHSTWGCRAGLFPGALPEKLILDLRQQQQAALAESGDNEASVTISRMLFCCLQNWDWYLTSVAIECLYDNNNSIFWPMAQTGLSWFDVSVGPPSSSSYSSPRNPVSVAVVNRCKECAVRKMSMAIFEFSTLLIACGFDTAQARWSSMVGLPTPVTMSAPTRWFVKWKWYSVGWRVYVSTSFLASNSPNHYHLSSSLQRLNISQQFDAAPSEYNTFEDRRVNMAS